MQVLVSVGSTLLQWFVAPALYRALAQRLQLTEALHFRAVLTWAVQHWTAFFKVGPAPDMASMGLMLTALLAGLMALGVGLLVTFPLAGLLVHVGLYHLYGQLARYLGPPGTTISTPLPTIGAAEPYELREKVSWELVAKRNTTPLSAACPLCAGMCGQTRGIAPAPGSPASARGLYCPTPGGREQPTIHSVSTLTGTSRPQLRH